jgi:hypothetical protein
MGYKIFMSFQAYLSNEQPLSAAAFKAKLADIVWTEIVCVRTDLL